MIPAINPTMHDSSIPIRTLFPMLSFGVIKQRMSVNVTVETRNRMHSTAMLLHTSSTCSSNDAHFISAHPDSLVEIGGGSSVQLHSRKELKRGTLHHQILNATVPCHSCSRRRRFSFASFAAFSSVALISCSASPARAIAARISWKISLG